MEKKKFFVNIPFSGSLSVAVVAEDEQQAMEIGQEVRFEHLEVYVL